MRIRWPAMPHGVRRYLIELVIVAVGVMMGLAATEAVKAFSDAREVHAIREALDSELSNSYYAIEHRHRLSPCVERRARELLDWLDLPPEKRPALPWKIGGISGIATYENVWAVAEGNGSVAKMSVPDLVRYARVYGSVANFTRLRDAENEAWKDVTDLGGRRTLDEREAALMGLRVEQALTRQATFEHNRGNVIEDFTRMGIRPESRREADRAFNPSICEPLFAQ